MRPLHACILIGRLGGVSHCEFQQGPIKQSHAKHTPFDHLNEVESKAPMRRHKVEKENTIRYFNAEVTTRSISYNVLM